VNPLVLVVDDEPDVEVLFRQQFRRLAPVYGRFTEGQDTRDLKDAKALLDELAI
jgi:hypothetical protein